MLKIVASDVTPHSCRILDEAGNDTGLTECVTSIRLDLRADDINKATFELGLIAAEIAVGVVKWVTTHPLSKDMAEVAAIEFRDGLRLEFSPDGAFLPASKS